MDTLYCASRTRNTHEITRNTERIVDGTQRCTNSRKLANRWSFRPSNQPQQTQLHIMARLYRTLTKITHRKNALCSSSVGDAFNQRASWVVIDSSFASLWITETGNEMNDEYFSAIDFNFDVDEKSRQSFFKWQTTFVPIGRSGHSLWEGKKDFHFRNRMEIVMETTSKNTQTDEQLVLQMVHPMPFIFIVDSLSMSYWRSFMKFFCYCGVSNHSMQASSWRLIIRNVIGNREHKCKSVVQLQT